MLHLAMTIRRAAASARPPSAMLRWILPPGAAGGEGSDVSIVAWILLGLVAGVIAKMLMPGDDPGGLIVTVLIGIVGALIGGVIWNFLSGNDSYGDFDIGGIVIAVLGSLILLWAYRKFAARRAT